MEIVNMDSQGNFYDTEEQGLAKEETFFLDDRSLPSLEDLDPSVELSFDLEELIKNQLTSGGVTNNGGELFPELQAPAASCYQPLETEPHQLDHHMEYGSTVKSETTSQQLIADDTKSTLMPQILEVESSQAGTRGTPLFSVKQEDLEALGLVSSNKKGVVYLKIQTCDSHKPEQRVSSSTDSDSSGYIEGEPTTSRPATAGTRNPLKATPASKSCSRRRNLVKDTEEYKEKRARNNEAVRKSRDKAKIRQQETECRVTSLSQENDRLQKKVDLLTKELTVLKGLFTNVGATLPKELEDVLN